MNLSNTLPELYWPFLDTAEIIGLISCNKRFRKLFGSMWGHAHIDVCRVDELWLIRLRPRSLTLFAWNDFLVGIMSVKKLSTDHHTMLAYFPNVESLSTYTINTSVLHALPKLHTLNTNYIIADAKSSITHLYHHDTETFDLTKFPKLQVLSTYIKISGVTCMIRIDFGSERDPIMDEIKKHPICDKLKMLTEICGKVSLELFDWLPGFDKNVVGLLYSKVISIHQLKTMRHLKKLSYYGDRIEIHCRKSRFLWWPELDYIHIPKPLLMEFVLTIHNNIGPDNHSPLSFECNRYRDKNYVIIYSERISLSKSLRRTFGIMN